MPGASGTSAASPARRWCSASSATQTLENFDRVRLVGPMTAVFFLVAAIPTFMFLRERGTPKMLPPGETMLGMGFRRLVETGRALGGFRDLLVFFVAFFFAMAGLSIVIAFAFIYGDQVIRWSPTSQMLMFVITNLTASVGAVGFGFLQKRWGNLRTFNLTLAIWVVAIVGIWGTPGITVWLNARARHRVARRARVPLHGRDGGALPRRDAVREPDHRGGVQPRVEVGGVLRLLGAVRETRRRSSGCCRSACCRCAWACSRPSCSARCSSWRRWSLTLFVREPRGRAAAAAYSAE